MKNELIKITTNEEGKKLVSARELHEFLEIKSVFSTWFNRMKEYGFETNIDFIEIWSDSKNGNAVEYLGSPQKMSAKGYEVDYAISIDMAKELSMIQRTDKGKQARKYFIECEKQLKQSQQPQLPQTYLEALKSLVASEEERLRLEEEKKQLIEEKDQLQSTLDKFLSTKGLYDIGTFAKVLDIPKLGRNNMFKWFKTHNYLMSSNEPYQQYMKYFSVKNVERNSMVVIKTLLKPEGVIYFYKKISQEFNINKTIEQVSKELNEEE